MTFPGYLVETNIVDPVTGEPVFSSTPVVPEESENLLASSGAEGGCCGGSCCQ